MPGIKVNNVICGTTDKPALAEAYKEVFALPLIQASEPKEPLDPQKVCVIYEGEAGLASKDSTISHLASVDVNSCIFVLIYNNENHLAIHVRNQTASLGLETFLGRFSHQNDLKVKLMGGMPDFMTSRLILTKILQDLLAYALAHDITITIESQRLLKHNAMQEKDHRYTAQTNIMDFAQRMYRENFGKPMSYATICEYKADDFNSDQNMAGMVGFMLPIFAMWLNANPDYHMPIINPAQTEAQFHTNLQNLFSKQGYALNNNTASEGPLKPAGYRHIAFDLKTGELIRIARLFPTPNAASRKLRVFDIENETRAPYILIFDGKDYHFPELSEVSKSNIASVLEYLKGGMSHETLNKIKALRPQLHVLHVRKFMDAILDAARGEEMRPILAPAGAASSSSSVSRVITSITRTTGNDYEEITFGYGSNSNAQNGLGPNETSHTVNRLKQ